MYLFYGFEYSYFFILSADVPQTHPQKWYFMDTSSEYLDCSKMCAEKYKKLKEKKSIFSPIFIANNVFLRSF